MRLKSASLAVLLLFMGLAPAAYAQSPPAPAVMDAEAWRKDIDVLTTEFERRHKNLFHTVSREAFFAAAADLKARVPQMQRHEIIVGMIRLAAMVGDGHTNIYPWEDKKVGFHLVPVKFYLFEDGLYVIAAAPEQAALAGARVESFAGVPAAEAVRRVMPLLGRDNDVGGSAAVPLALAMPEILHAVGLSPTPDGAVLGVSKGGKRWTARLGSRPNDLEFPDDIDISLETPRGWTDAGAAKPVWLQDMRSLYRVVEMPERKALYVQLNEVYDAKGESLAQFGARIHKLAVEKNPERVVLDIRLNRGGNLDLTPPFVREMIRMEDGDTKLFLLIGRATFSAAQFLTDDLDIYSTAVLVGEPTGSKPNAYGDSRGFNLPNSGIRAYPSTLWWQRNQDMARKWTAPDVAAPLNFADYRQGRDPALEVALAWQPGPTPREIFGEAAKRGGVAEVLRAVDAFASVTANRYVDLQRPLLLTGYELYQRKQLADAVAILEFNAQRHPEAFDAFNFLAHVALAAGEVDKARAANARALELRPTNSEALARADKLRTQQ